MTRLLKGLSTNTPDIEGAAIVDNDGLLIASALSQDVDEEAVAAMGAALLGIGERIVDELGRGSFQMVTIRGTEGYVVIVRCGEDAVLSVLTSARAKLGLVYLDVRRTAKELAKILD